MPLMPRLAPTQPLSPTQEMARNDPCWCGSGRKWKSCHRNRHLEPRTNIHQYIAQRENYFTKGQCGHPDAPNNCSGEAINSHTLQKGGALAAVAENGHVISAREGSKRLLQNVGQIVPQKTGVRKASTFPGFCNAHDTAFFLPIESGALPLTRESAFLLKYRTMAYERHAKAAAIQMLNDGRDMMDAGLPYHQQAAIQMFLRSQIEDLRHGLNDLDKLKGRLDQMHLSGDTTKLGLMAVTFEGILPFVGAFIIIPTVDFQGVKRQSLDALHVSMMSLTVTVASNQTIALFSWLDGPTCVGAKIASSFEIVAKADRPTALLRYCLAKSENVHMRPSWWNRLSETEQADADALVNMTPDVGDSGIPAHFVVGQGPLSLEPMASHVLHL